AATAAATERLAAAGMQTRVEDGTTCCYAVQDKVWVTGPGEEPWEVYTVLADAGTDLEGKTLAQVHDLPAEACAGDTEAACCAG
ncbi:MAG TPA: glyoxalase/bleomycin resistance/dioxygenase family protein, partial [Nocardioidaceae bacterium]|nr:glyoxalase/bleomycin resistance/dioxygenase family protein [Nocardioidaceae bacterium]